MTADEEFGGFVGPSTEDDDYDLCPGCHDYPCCCTADEIMLRDDWNAEIEWSNKQ
jgi:hypothetical protein